MLSKKKFIILHQLESLYTVQRRNVQSRIQIKILIKHKFNETKCYTKINIKYSSLYRLHHGIVTAPCSHITQSVNWTNYGFS